MFIFNIKKILMDVVSEKKEKTFKKNNQNWIRKNERKKNLFKNWEERKSSKKIKGTKPFKKIKTQKSEESWFRFFTINDITFSLLI